MEKNINNFGERKIPVGEQEDGSFRLTQDNTDFEKIALESGEFTEEQISQIKNDVFSELESLVPEKFDMKNGKIIMNNIFSEMESGKLRLDDWESMVVDAENAGINLKDLMSKGVDSLTEKAKMLFEKWYLASPTLLAGCTEGEENITAFIVATVLIAWAINEAGKKHSNNENYQAHIGDKMEDLEVREAVDDLEDTVESFVQKTFDQEDWYQFKDINKKGFLSSPKRIKRKFEIYKKKMRSENMVKDIYNTYGDDSSLGRSRNGDGEEFLKDIIRDYLQKYDFDEALQRSIQASEDPDWD